MSPFYPRDSGLVPGSGIGLLREISFSRRSAAPIRVKIALKYEEASSDFDSVSTAIPDGGALRRLVVQSNDSGPYDIVIYKDGMLFHSVTVTGTTYSDASLFLAINPGEKLSVFTENNSASDASEIVATLFLE